MLLITLLGATSSGKSDLAVNLAKDLIAKNIRTWIIGCDSRQIYKYLNVGTGKVEGNWEQIPISKRCFYPSDKVFFYQEIPHFLIDYKDPYHDFEYSLVQYLIDFNELFKNTKILPNVVILTGGTGLYAKAILEEYQLFKIKPDFEQLALKFKQNIEKLNLYQLQENYLKLELPKLNSSDFENPRRIINHIYKNQVKTEKWGVLVEYPSFIKKFNFAIKTEITDLKPKIRQRLEFRLENGLIPEILKHKNLGQKKLLSLGLEYRLGFFYMNGMLTKSEFLQKLKVENFKYAKRQLTWLKKQKPIWISHKIDILTNINKYI